MYVRFPGTEITALDRVVEQAPHAVSVILIILSGIDSALSRHTVRSTWGILNAEVENVVSQFTQGGCGSTAAKTCSNNDDGVFPLVGWGNQIDVLNVLFPLFFNRPGGAFSI